MRSNIVLAITSGEPAGIGPDLCIQLAQLSRSSSYVVFADSALLQQRAKQLGLELQIQNYQQQQAITHKEGQLCVFHTPIKAPCSAGKLNPANAQYVLTMLETAANGCRLGEFSALVTAPVQKSVINDAGFAFSGHTEFFAALCGVEKVVMMLAHPRLRVALVTTHLPLRMVPEAITKAELTRTIEILHHSLEEQFGIQKPRILVAGLNPHAGEDGHLGDEEINIIRPVIENLNAKGMNLLGPLPADTLFTEQYLDSADAALAMYHDQGLPVLKHSGFGEAVNITLGLPFIRTSVDHGTALDLAGTGKASNSSLEAAIVYAEKMVSRA
ncbi:MAG: 4-hydroxythreonine-4-phosphate dehydrogenase PdxA [Pseudomonadales bacterium]|nr:4-hydroxythreonine-4-phosphate dehydrogenase PdxA [Pseudomonadales bacterium]